MRIARWPALTRRTGVSALVGGAMALGAAPALALSTTSYRGRTSQGLAVTMVASGSRIQRLTIAWVAHCAALDAPVTGLSTFHEGVALRRGAWSAAGTYSAHVRGGYDEEFAVSDHGTLAGARRVSGAFSGTVQIFQGTGARHRRIDTCQSGKVTFTLTRTR